MVFVQLSKFLASLLGVFAVQFRCFLTAKTGRGEVGGQGDWATKWKTLILFDSWTTWRFNLGVFASSLFKFRYYFNSQDAKARSGRPRRPGTQIGNSDLVQSSTS